MSIFSFGASHSEGYVDLSFAAFDKYREWLGVDTSKNMPPTWIEILGNKFNCDYKNFGKGAASNQEIFFQLAGQITNIKKGDIVIINWASSLRCLWLKNHEIVSISPQNKIQENVEQIIPYIKETYEIIAKKRSSPKWLIEIQRYEDVIDALAESIGFDVYYWFTDDVLLATTKEDKNYEQNKRKYLLSDLIELNYGKQIFEILSLDINVLNKLGTNKCFIDEKVNTDIINKIQELTFYSPMCCILFDILRKYGATTLIQETNGVVPDKYHLSQVGHKVQAELFYSYITNTPYPKILTNDTENKTINR